MKIILLTMAVILVISSYAQKGYPKVQKLRDSVFVGLFSDTAFGRIILTDVDSIFEGIVVKEFFYRKTIPIYSERDQKIVDSIREVELNNPGTFSMYGSGNIEYGQQRESAFIYLNDEYLEINTKYTFLRRWGKKKK